MPWNAHAQAQTQVDENEKHYTATSSRAEGVMNTDDSVPPPLTDEHQTTTNQTEPAAVGTDSGSTFAEIKQFAQNTAEKTRAALKGENRSQTQKKTLETEKEKRFYSTFSTMKEQVIKAKEDTKQALKDVTNAAVKAATAGKAEVEKNVNKAEAKAYAYSGKSEMDEVIDSTKNAAKDTYNTAKENLESGTEDLKSKASNYADNMAKKASETKKSIKEATGMSGSRPAATADPRTDRPTSGADYGSRSDI